MRNRLADDRSNLRRLMPVALLGVIAATSPVRAAQASNPAPASAQQTQRFGETVVTSDMIVYDFEKRTVVATGRVVLVSGNSRITAEKMTVQMTPKREVEWAICEEKVRVERKSPDDGTTLTGTGARLEYYEKDQKANLQGDAVVLQSSPRLAKPAEITGSRIDMDLAAKVNVVKRRQNEPAKVHVEPKGTEKEPDAEPADLSGDQITMNARTQEYEAIGSPVFVRPTSKLQAKRISFKVDEKTNDIEVANAEDAVVFDGRGKNGSVIHTTGDKGVYTKKTSELVLTGQSVHATVLDPGDETPTVYEGQRFVYNTLTRGSSLSGDGSRPASLVLPPGKAGGPGSPSKPGDAKTPDAKDGKKAGEKADKPAETGGKK